MSLKERDSNFELMRIIAILMIIGCHFILKCNNFSLNFGVPQDQLYDYELNLNYLFAQLVGSGGEIGVNLFFLITGYFLINNPSFRISATIKLWIRTILYSILFSLIFFIFDHDLWTQISDLKKDFFPVIFNRYWFISIYIGLMFISPVLSLGLDKIKKKGIEFILVVGCLIYYLLPNCYFYFTKEQLQPLGYNELVRACYFFVIGGYLSKYIKNIQINFNVALLQLVTILLFYCLFIVYVDLNYHNKINCSSWYFYIGGQGFASLLLSISLFLFISKIAISSKIINFLAKCSLGVYIIHENFYMNFLLWGKIFRLDHVLNTVWFIPWTIACIIAIWLVCCLIDIVISFLFEKLFKLFNSYLNKVDLIGRKFINL